MHCALGETARRVFVISFPALLNDGRDISHCQSVLGGATGRAREEAEIFEIGTAARYTGSGMWEKIRHPLLSLFRVRSENNHVSAPAKMDAQEVAPGCQKHF